MNTKADTTFVCLICKEDRSYYAFGACEHEGICMYCSMRMRILYKDKKCPVCISKLDNIYFCDLSDPKKSYKQLEKDKEDMIKDDEFEDNHIYYTSYSLKEESLKLRNFICPISNCADGSFETLTHLINHLNKVHKRFYCEICLKGNKKFLSEMNIYNQEKLKEHIEYGEYTKCGELITPPHPECQFCKIRFFNDEGLYKHLTEHHFNCQVCKDRKNLVFYQDIPSLSNHYQNDHYVCPYEECLQDIFVVFQTENELNSHFITKHKCTSATNKLTNFTYDNSTKKYKKTSGSSQNNNNEFSFSNYVKKLKENMEYYVKNNMHLKDNLYEVSNQPNIEKIDDHHNYYGKFDSNYKKKNKQLRYDKNSQYYDYYGKFNNTNEQYTNYGNEQYYYDNQNYYYGNEYYDNSNTRGGKKKKKNEEYYEEPKQTKPAKQDIFQEFAQKSEIHDIQDNKVYGFKKGGKGKKGKNQNFQNHNNYDNKFEDRPIDQNKRNINNNTQPTQPIIQEKANNIDYLSVIINLLNVVREFIAIKIKSDKISRKECLVAKEVIYQMIVIIHKVEKIKDIVELKSVCHFGFPLSECKDLREFIQEGIVDKDIIFDILKKVEFKKNFILFKFLDIANKKFNGLFYKLDIEQIDEDLYSEFIHEEKGKKKGNLFDKDKSDSSTKQTIPLKSNKRIFNEENFPDLFGENNLQVKNLTLIEEEAKAKENKPNPLKSILSKDNKDKKNTVETKKTTDKVFTPMPEYEAHQPSKLKDILSSNTSKKVLQIPKKRPQGGLNMSNKEKFNEMFPEL